MCIELIVSNRWWQACGAWYIRRRAHLPQGHAPDTAGKLQAAQALPSALWLWRERDHHDHLRTPSQRVLHTLLSRSCAHSHILLHDNSGCLLARTHGQAEVHACKRCVRREFL